MAGAPYGNKNAEKWTFKKSVALFNDAIRLTNETETVKVFNKSVKGYKYDFIGEIARELGTFHEIFAHLVERFPSLSRLKNELDNNIQSNCYSNTKKGIIREATGIVNLKSNWKWTDRSQLDHTTKGDKIKTVSDFFPTDEELSNGKDN